MTENKAENKIELRNIYSLSRLRFFIPDYQRGYRWSEYEVVKMLEDFKEFAQKDKKPEEFYCLQPIVIRRKTWKGKKEEVEKEIEGYEVIDGQQRLTTLYIILKSQEIIREETSEFVPFSIKYETREEYNSEDFLENIDKKSDEEANVYIDFYHMKLVYDAVIKWFDENKDMKYPIITNMLAQSKNVRVIWYELDDEKSTPHEVFSRLNIGKIPLTNAELIKALFLRRGSDYANSGATARQLLIANEWNAIEQKLEDDSFWHFIYKSTNEIKYVNRIEYIFDLMKDRKPGSEYYFTFNEFCQGIESLLQENTARTLQDCIDNAWGEVKSWFQTLEEWFDDRLLYHFIGFLIETDFKIDELRKEFNARTKTSFFEYIKEKISSRINVKHDELESLSYGDSRIRKVLLLFNLLTCVNDEKSDMRFPFDKFKENSWDIEHVCSQTDINLSNPNKRLASISDMLEYFVGSSNEENVVAYLEKLRDKMIVILEKLLSEYGEYIDDIYVDINIKLKVLQEKYQSCVKKEVTFLEYEYLQYEKEYDVVDKISKYNKNENKESDFRNLYEEIMKYVGENNIRDKDCIANLTLLDYKTNRSYGNAFFPVKRKRIIDNDRYGIFVPIATKNLFLKYYSRRSHNLMQWENEDAKNYLEKMKQTLDDYLL